MTVLEVEKKISKFEKKLLDRAGSLMHSPASLIVNAVRGNVHGLLAKSKKLNESFSL